MLKYILLVGLTIGSIQKGPPTVHRVFVSTERSSTVVFEYANAAFPEDEVLSPGAIDCFRSQLIGTGIFSDVKVVQRPLGDDKVDITIFPTWNKDANKLTIREFTVEGFTKIYGDQLLEFLRLKGLKPQTAILKFGLPTIRNMAIDAVREIHSSDVRSMNDAEEDISQLAIRIELLAPGAVKLRLMKSPDTQCRVSTARQ